MKFNKKIFGFALGILLFGGFATALIVNYMSNEAKVSESVSLAMDVSFADLSSDLFPLERTTDWTTELTTNGVTQLSTSIVGVKLINNADVQIQNEYLEVVVSNDLNDVSCDDITSLQFLDTATPIQLAKGFQELSSLCVDLGDSIVYDVPINSLASGQTYEYPAKITYGIVQPTNYHYNAQMVHTPAI
jgi:hypothetical protein